MTKQQIIWAVIINSLWVIPMLIVVVIEPLQDAIKLHKRNKSFHAINGYKLRLRCMECKYCTTFIHRPFYKYGKYGNFMTSKYPKYCRRFKKQLRPEYNLRCISKIDEYAFYENSNEK